MEKTVALFDLPYQWIFPVVFVVMTGVIAIFFMKYVIFAENTDDDAEQTTLPPPVESEPPEACPPVIQRPGVHDESKLH